MSDRGGDAPAAERVADRPEEVAQLRLLSRERANLRAALRWALDTCNVAYGLRLHAALFSFWIYCSDPGEARTWLDAVLALPRDESTPQLLRDAATTSPAACYATALQSELPATRSWGGALERGRDTPPAHVITHALADVGM